MGCYGSYQQSHWRSQLEKEALSLPSSPSIPLFASPSPPSPSLRLSPPTPTLKYDIPSGMIEVISTEAVRPALCLRHGPCKRPRLILPSRVPPLHTILIFVHGLHDFTIKISIFTLFCFCFKGTIFYK